MVDQEAEASATLLLLLTLLFLPFQAFQNKTRTVDQLIHINIIQQCWHLHLWYVVYVLYACTLTTPLASSMVFCLFSASIVSRSMDLFFLHPFLKFCPIVYSKSSNTIFWPQLTSTKNCPNCIILSKLSNFVQIVRTVQSCPNCPILSKLSNFDSLENIGSRV